ncbi:TPA: ERF family protein [Cronobacter sakazakii]|uniref:ERF family protein n=1 Tax=Cronobacter sakazakii TaxID=28141 RepID=UPI001375F5DD|nr:ERF family protein [Cronobacter sakazakii]NCH12503.1 recombinase [Cronobacter sakazakii]HDK7242315.1 ERF family protein [Cronobacter sakazakii]HDK7258479.1 ERF family protein [Cronobacter sakazakii]HDK7328348.1 ERF family protein [Cronobacter sakazakii]HDK7383311.1 ERF family protein [Cronobacter sakazakii]
MSKEFYARLAKIQAHLNAPKNQYNSFGKYKYRSCEDILEGVKPLLDGLFLSISDEIVLIGDRHYVKAVATITDGESCHTATAMAREEESKKGMDAAQVTGATSSYARKYCLNGLFGIDDAKDADTDEHKQQQYRQVSNAPAKQPASPEQVLKAFTEAASAKNSVAELKGAFAKAWKMLEGTPEQQKAQDIYNIRKDELEGMEA